MVFGSRDSESQHPHGAESAQIPALEGGGQDGDLNEVSETKQMDTCRIFIRWLESIDGVEQDLSEKVVSGRCHPERIPDTSCWIPNAPRRSSFIWRNISMPVSNTSP